MKISVRFHKALSLFAALSFFAACMVSCSKTYKDIELKDISIEKVNVSSLKSVDAVLNMVVDNPAVQKFKVQNIRGTVYQKGEKVATFSSSDVVNLEPKKVSESKIKVRVTLESTIGFLESLTEDKGLKLKNYTLDISADVTSGILTFPYSKKGMEVGSMLKSDKFKDF
ncbi:MAG: LEA type 2 family protein [Bacteroidales bacterium]|nr:LEA type 2 family protein [Bacteroidales bacterium]MBQ2492227.1 LEA type 2 family protein [Bacteroidales bacterium]MBQ4196976.1 LEA type 2 family protein [Bacteroidales bacterium]